MDGLINKHIKCVYLDANQERVVRGILKNHDEHTLTIIGDRDGKDVVIGKGVLVSLKEDYKDNDYQNRRE